MFQKIKAYLDGHSKQAELLRYVIAGGLTTLLSMIIHYGLCFLMVEKDTFIGGSLIGWVVDAINCATPLQLTIASTASWIISVLFAFWINRVMVFQVEGGSKAKIGTELVQFAGGRLLSFFLFEQGLMLGLKWIGVSNFINRIVVLLFVMVFNYVISKFLIFKKA